MSVQLQVINISGLETFNSVKWDCSFCSGQSRVSIFLRQRNKDNHIENMRETFYQSKLIGLFDRVIYNTQLPTQDKSRTLQEYTYANNYGSK